MSGQTGRRRERAVGRAVLVALPVAPNGLVSAASGPGEAQWSAQWSWRRRQRAGFEGGCRDDIWARVVGFPIPRTIGSDLLSLLKHLGWFLFAALAVLVIITYVPQLSLWYRYFF